MATVDLHKTYSTTFFFATNNSGEFEGLSKEIISILRIDKEYIK